LAGGGIGTEGGTAKDKRGKIDRGAGGDAEKGTGKELRPVDAPISKPRDFKAGGIGGHARRELNHWESAKKGEEEE